MSPRQQLRDAIAAAVSLSLLAWLGAEMQDLDRRQQRQAAALTELQRRIPFSDAVALEAREWPGGFGGIVAMRHDGSEVIVDMWRRQ